jgi:hypothetical protein
MGIEPTSELEIVRETSQSTKSSRALWMKNQVAREKCAEVVKSQRKMVGANGFEPSTSWSRTRRASQAALRPDRCSLSVELEGARKSLA